MMIMIETRRVHQIKYLRFFSPLLTKTLKQNQQVSTLLPQA